MLYLRSLRTYFNHSTTCCSLLKNTVIMQRNNSYKVLNVAEKNDAAKRISDILSERGYQRVNYTVVLF